MLPGSASEQAQLGSQQEAPGGSMLHVLQRDSPYSSNPVEPQHVASVRPPMQPANGGSSKQEVAGQRPSGSSSQQPRKGKKKKKPTKHGGEGAGEASCPAAAAAAAPCHNGSRSSGCRSGLRRAAQPSISDSACSGPAVTASCGASGASCCAHRCQQLCRPAGGGISGKSQGLVQGLASPPSSYARPLAWQSTHADLCVLPSATSQLWLDCKPASPSWLSVILQHMCLRAAQSHLPAGAASPPSPGAQHHPAAAAAAASIKQH